MKDWIKELCPEIADWQAELIAEHCPPKREWQGLSDEEKELIVNISCKRDSSHDDAERVARAIEAKLKEKNT